MCKPVSTVLLGPPGAPEVQMTKKYRKNGKKVMQGTKKSPFKIVTGSNIRSLIQP